MLCQLKKKTYQNPNYLCRDFIKFGLISIPSTKIVQNHSPSSIYRDLQKNQNGSKLEIPSEIRAPLNESGRYVIIIV